MISQQTQKDDDGTTSTTVTTTNANTNNNNNEEIHRQNEIRMDEIEEYTKRTQPLTSERKQLQDYCTNVFPLSTTTTEASAEEVVTVPTSSIPTNNNSNNSTIIINNYQNGIEMLLKEEYTSYRSVRGDGNCFYRAFLYSLIETLYEFVRKEVSTATNCTTNRTTTSQEEEARTGTGPSSSSGIVNSMVQWFKVDSLQLAIDVGQYDEMTLEIFYDCIIDLIERIVHIPSQQSQTNETPASTSTSTTTTTTTTTILPSWEQFHTELNEENSTSDYCTWYLRVITATYIKSDPERFVPFIIGSTSSSGTSTSSSGEHYSYDNDSHAIVQQFCIREVEPMGKECEQIQVLALTEALNVQVIIEYLDGRRSYNTSNNNNNNNSSSDNSGVSRHIFGGPTSTNNNNNNNNNNPIQLTFLYRPGHYDILYK